VIAPSIHSIHAADDVTLSAVKAHADGPSRIDSIVVVENTRAQNRTLGNMLERVSGVQSSAFGPMPARR